jgi:hypothetical protein
VLKIAPEHVEFRRAHLYNVNPVGFGSMVVASTLSIMAYFGLFRAALAALAPFVSLVLAMVLPPILAVATKGRWYISRTSDFPAGAERLTCGVSVRARTGASRTPGVPPAPSSRSGCPR